MIYKPQYMVPCENLIQQLPSILRIRAQAPELGSQSLLLYGLPQYLLFSIVSLTPKSRSGPSYDTHTCPTDKLVATFVPGSPKQTLISQL